MCIRVGQDGKWGAGNACIYSSLYQMYIIRSYTEKYQDGSMAPGLLAYASSVRVCAGEKTRRGACIH